MKSTYDICGGLYHQRALHHLKQEYCANILGLGRGAYGQYERGDRNLSIEHAVILADYYGITIDELIKRKVIE